MFLCLGDRRNAFVASERKFSVIRKLLGRNISGKFARWVVITGQTHTVWVAMRRRAQDARQVSHNLFLSLVFNQFHAYTVDTCARRRKNERPFGDVLFLKVLSLLYHGQFSLLAVSPMDCSIAWALWQSLLWKCYTDNIVQLGQKDRWTSLTSSFLHESRSALTQRGHTVSGHDNA